MFLRSILFVLLFCSNICFTLESGGGGYGVEMFFETSPVLYTNQYYLPTSNDGLSFTFWVKLPLIRGEKIMQVFSITKPNGIDVDYGVSIHYKNEKAIIAFQIDSFHYLIDSTIYSDCFIGVNCWAFYSFSWSNIGATTTVTVQINGERMTINQSPLTLRLFSISPVEECKTTSGGYVSEGTACSFPFRYDNLIYNNCTSFLSVPPYVNKNKKPNIPVEVTDLWCPTVNEYSSTKADVRSLWGYCHCKESQRIEEYFFKSLKQAEYSGKYPSISKNWNKMKILQSCEYEEQEEEASLSDTVMIINSSLCSTEKAFLLSSKLNEKQVPIVLFASDKKLFDPHSINADNQILLACGEEFGALVDLNAETSWKSPKTCGSSDIILSTTRLGPPFVLVYSFLIPVATTLENIKWKVFADSGKSLWTLVDQRVGKDLTEISFKNVTRQYFFPLSIVSQSEQKRETFKFQFEGDSCEQLEITEITMFSSSLNSDGVSINLFRNGMVSRDSYYSRKLGMERNTLNSFVASISPITTNFFDLIFLNQWNIQVYSTAIKRISSSTVNTSPRRLLIGQVMNRNNSYDSQKAFAGLIDELTIFSMGLSDAELNQVFTNKTSFLSGRYSYYDFNQESGIDTGSSKQHLISTKSASFCNELFCEEAVSVSRLFIPNENIQDDILVIPLSSSQQNILLSGRGNNNSSIKFEIVTSPRFGKLSNLNSMPSLTYTMNSPVSNWKKDSFSYSVSSSVKKIYPVSLVPSSLGRIFKSKNNNIQMKTQSYYAFELYGGFSYSNRSQLITTCLNLTSIRVGKVFLADDNCNALALNLGYYCFQGFQQFRYKGITSGTDFMSYHSLENNFNGNITFVVSQPQGIQFSQNQYFSMINENLVFKSRNWNPGLYSLEVLKAPSFGSLFWKDTKVEVKDNSKTVSNYASELLHTSASGFSTSLLLEEPDGIGFQFDSLSAGHEYVEVKFPAKVISESIEITLRKGGEKSLFRVSYLPATSLALEEESCVFSSSCPLQEFDRCQASSSWIVTWQRSQCSIALKDDDNDWITLKFPLCSLGTTTDTIRLDFNTIGNQAFVEIDSLRLIGFTSSTSSVTMINQPNISFSYIPLTTGISGQDNFAFRTLYKDCTASETIIQVFPLLPTIMNNNNSNSFFYELPPSLTQPGENTFDFSFQFDYSAALLFITQNYFKLDAIEKTTNLWGFDSKFNVTIILIDARNNVIYGDTHLIPVRTPNDGSIVQSVSFVHSGLSNDYLLAGDLRIQAMLSVLFLSDSISLLRFHFSSKLLGSCSQASVELGPCSQKGRPYLYPGSCILSEKGYGCQCYESSLPQDTLDVVVAGKYCEFDTFSTCHGRGHPNDKGICTCFEPTLFASEHCEKRFQNVSNPTSLVEELGQTLKKFGVAFSLLPNLKNLRIEAGEMAAELIADDDISGKTIALISLLYSIEFDPANTCHAHGIPIGSAPLSQTFCLCQEEYRPNLNCISQIICFPGQYISDGFCTTCPQGYYCDSGVVKRPCQNGTFTLYEGSFRCYPNCIEAGYPSSYFKIDEFGTYTCHTCSLGSECDGRVSRKCQTSTFGTKSLVCIPCNDVGLKYYSNTTGSLSCMECPQFSSRLSESTGSTLEECVCLPGYWNGIPTNPSMTGVPCHPCPDFGTCEGYELNFNATSTSNRTSSRRLLSPTIYQNSKPYPQPGYWGDIDYPSKFFECDEGACQGGKEFLCNDGNEGRLCSICEPGYHNINGQCTPCPPSASERINLVFWGITLILVAFVLLNRASTEVTALDIALLYTQVCGVVQQFSFYWPYPVAALNDIYSLTDFDVDFVTYSCATNSTWSFTAKFYSQWFLVWYVGAAILLVNLVAYYYSRYREKQDKIKSLEDENIKLMSIKRKAGITAARLARTKSSQVMNTGSSNSNVNNNSNSFLLEDSKTVFPEQENNSSSEDDLEEMKKWSSIFTWKYWKKHLDRNDDLFDPRLKAIASWLKKTLGLPNNAEEYKHYTNGQLSAYINLIGVTYKSLLVICLDSLFCFSLANGTSVLRVWPDLLCYTDEWSALVFFGSLGLIIYGIGCPLFVFIVLKRGSQKNLKGEDNFQEIFGTLYLDYRQELYLWELAVLFRRFAMCVILVTARGLPFVQGAVGSIVIVLCLAVQLIYAPYQSKRINALETIALASILFYIVCGLIFTGLALERNSTVNDTFSIFLSYFLLIVSVLTIGACFYVFYLDVREYFNLLLIERSLYKKCMSETVSLIRVMRGDEIAPPLADLRLGQDVHDFLNNNKYGIKLRQLRDKKKKKRNSNMLSPQTPGVTTPTTPSSATKSLLPFKKPSNVLRRRATGTRNLFFEIDQDKGGTLSKGELLEFVVNVLGMEEDFSRERIERIFRKFDLDVSETFDIFEFVALLRSALPVAVESELKNTIKAEYLWSWSKSPTHCTPLNIAMFFELDESMKSIVADDSIVSVYSNSTEALFYRTCLGAFPFLIDWLSAAKMEDVITLRRILQELHDCRNVVGGKGSISRLIVPIDRAPVAYWFLNAKEQERETFRIVFKSIASISEEHRTSPCFGEKETFPIWEQPNNSINNTNNKKTDKSNDDEGDDVNIAVDLNKIPLETNNMEIVDV